MYFIDMLPRIFSFVSAFHLVFSATVLALETGVLAHDVGVPARDAGDLWHRADSRVLDETRAQRDATSAELDAVNAESDSPSNAEKVAPETSAELIERDGTDSLDSLNQELETLRDHLHEVHLLARLRCQEDPNREALLPLVKRAATLRQQLLEKEVAWRQIAKRQPSAGESGNEQSATWHFPEITLFQLIVEFGSQEHLYLIPPELSSQKVSVVAGFAIPRSSWPDLVNWILAQQGLAIRPLNPFCREIFRATKDSLQIDAITTKRDDLTHFPPNARLCLVHRPIEQTQLTLSVLREFAHRNEVQLNVFSEQIALVGSADKILQLLRIADMVVQSAREQTFQVISLTRLSARDIERALDALGGIDLRDSGTAPPPFGLRAIALDHRGGQSLLLLGSQSDIARSQKLICEIEEQIDRDSGQQLLWHRCKNEQPQVLAELAVQLCNMLDGECNRGQSAEITFKKSPPAANNRLNAEREKNTSPQNGAEQLEPAKKGIVSGGTLQVTFDPKSGYLIMALPGHLMKKMQEALNRLDAPKEMVQIDLLLLERRVTDANRSGIQLLRLGSGASQKAAGGLNYSGGMAGGGLLNRGILEFFLSRRQGGNLPAYDLAYNFLISQENVKIHANPSVLTVNGVPASLNLIEETSLNTGMGRVEKGSRYLQNTYVRAKYGIRIDITPSVQQEKDGRFVTLDANLSFDTRKASEDDRPDVHTRQVKTLVRVADGERVILGGLRQREAEKSRESVPFLGDLPGIGKLFGTSVLIDRSTEMFLFITPKIISTSLPAEHQQVREQLMQRPGDIPEFIENCRLAKQKQNRQLPCSASTAQVSLREKTGDSLRDFTSDSLRDFTNDSLRDFN